MFLFLVSTCITAEMKHIEEFYEAHPEVEPKGLEMIIPSFQFIH